MKRCFSVICFCLVCCVIRADEPYRDFHDTQDRTVTAKIIKCDMKKGQVMVEMKDGKRRVTVPLAGFSDKDQTYIKQWYALNESLSESRIKIETKELTLEKRTEEDNSDAADSRSGSYIGNVQESIKYEEIAYEIVLQNRGSAPLKDLRIEYKIYYEQSKTTTGSPKFVQQIEYATIKIPELVNNKKVSFQTKPVEIYEEETILDPGMYYDMPPTGAEGEVHGMRARLYITLPSGQEAMREFCEPSSLSEDRYPWEEKKEE